MPSRLILMAAFGAALGIAQPTAPPETASTSTDVRETPRGALRGYLEACRDDDYRRAASFLNIRREHARSGSPEEMAKQLKQILDQKLLQDSNYISNSPEGDLTDGLEPHLELLGTINHADRNVDLLLERVTRPEVGQIWLISSATVSLIPVIHSEIGSNTIERHLPRWLLHRTALDTALWQWFALLLLILIAALFGHVLSRTLIRVLGPVVRRTRSGMDDRFLESLRKPMRLLLALAVYRVAIVWIEPSYVLRIVLSRILTAVIYFSIAWVFVRLVDVVITRLLSAMSGHQKTSAASTMPLMRRTLKAVVVVFAVLATLSSWGYDTTTLLAGLGVGGLAVALAAQKTLENLFGGIAITSDKPVLVGDFCRYGDKIGTVEDIGLRSTRIRSLDRTVVTVPNAEFSSLQIENFRKRDKMSFRPILQLQRDTTPARLQILLQRLRQLLLDDRLIERTPRVRLLAIGPQSLDIEIFSYILTPDYDEFLRKQEELLLQFLAIIAEEGATLAVPTQHTVLTRDGAKKSPFSEDEGRDS